MKFRETRLVALLCAALTALSACSAGDASQSECPDGNFVAVFVYEGDASRGGWNQSHELARAEVESLPCWDVNVIDQVPGDALAAAEFNRIAAGGANIVFATSPAFELATVQAAKANSATYFEHVGGYRKTANLGNYYGAQEEARYLAGMVAGYLSSSKKLGYIAASPNPETIRSINAFALGAQRVKPATTVEVQWIGTSSKSVAVTNAAATLLSSGVDVVTEHNGSLAVGQFVSEAGASWIGADADFSQSTDVWVAGSVWDWTDHYRSQMLAVSEGTWAGDTTYGSMASGMVKFEIADGVLTETARMELASVEASMQDGVFSPFIGPLHNQLAEEVAPIGVRLRQSEILGMDYFVNGVIGSATG